MTSQGRLRLLHFAPRVYSHPVNGAELRGYHLAAQLSRHMAVTHLGFSRPNENVEPAAKDSWLRMVAVPRSNGYRMFDLLSGLLGSTPFSVLNFARKEMARTLAQLLREERFDIVQLEGIHLGAYLPALRAVSGSPPLVVCDWHNIESEILSRYAETAKGMARRLYARQAAAKLERYERRFVQQCDLHVVVSERDRDTLVRYGTRAPIAVIENGVPAADFPPDPAPCAFTPGGRFRVLFVGAMDYHANIDAVTHFGRTAWPRIHAGIPESVFTIVGRDPSEAVRALGTLPGIEVTGTVPDVRCYYKEAFVALAPLRVAGGTRIKIVEAMAAGVPVVATARGAEGLAGVPDVHYILAETGEEMAQAVVELSQNAQKAARLVQAGRELVLKRYDWTALGDTLAARLLSLVQSAEPAARAVGPGT